MVKYVSSGEVCLNFPPAPHVLSHWHALSKTHGYCRASQALHSPHTHTHTHTQLQCSCCPTSLHKMHHAAASTVTAEIPPPKKYQPISVYSDLHSFFVYILGPWYHNVLPEMAFQIAWTLATLWPLTVCLCRAFTRSGRGEGSRGRGP